MGTTRDDGSQQSMWVSAADLPRGGGHPFYERLNRILEAAGFDAFVEGLCAQFYAAKMGRPGLAPGRYFRLLLIGYFEGLDSEREIAWRASDSLGLRAFLRLALPASPPDHSTISPGDLLARLMAAGQVELFVNVIWRELDMAIRQRPPAGHGLATTLDRIFAGDDWRMIDGDTANERMDQAVRLLSNRIGAKWRTYIRMTSGGDAVRYLLLHLTNHDQGRELMKECIWKVAPDGGFEVRQRDDHQQPLLIKPEPDLTPLREWLLERLRRRPHTKSELDDELRLELWLPTHLRTIVKRLRGGHEVEVDGSSGMISLPRNPRLPFS